MSSQSQRIAKKVERTVQKYGTSLTITRKVAGAYDPTQSSVAETVQTLPLKGVVQAYANALYRADLELKEGRPVKLRKVLLAGGVEPKLGDEIGLIDGETWKVTGIIPQEMDNQYISFELKVFL